MRLKNQLIYTLIGNVLLVIGGLYQTIIFPNYLGINDFKIFQEMIIILSIAGFFTWGCVDGYHLECVRQKSEGYINQIGILRKKLFKLNAIIISVTCLVITYINKDLLIWLLMFSLIINDLNLKIMFYRLKNKNHIIMTKQLMSKSLLIIMYTLLLFIGVSEPYYFIVAYVINIIILNLSLNIVNRIDKNNDNTNHDLLFFAKNGINTTINNLGNILVINLPVLIFFESNPQVTSSVYLFLSVLNFSVLLCVVMGQITLGKIDLNPIYLLYILILISIFSLYYKSEIALLSALIYSEYHFFNNNIYILLNIIFIEFVYRVVMENKLKMERIEYYSTFTNLFTGFIFVILLLLFDVNIFLLILIVSTLKLSIVLILYEKRRYDKWYCNFKL